MSELAEFLRARMFGDEQSVLSGDCHCNDGGQRPDCADRILREVYAKRLLLHGHEPEIHRCDGGDFAQGDSDCPIKCALASVYVIHEDYRPEWAAPGVYVAEKEA